MLATQFMNMIHAFSFYVILLGQKEKKKNETAKLQWVT